MLLKIRIKFKAYFNILQINIIFYISKNSDISNIKNYKNRRFIFCYEYNVLYLKIYK